MFSFFSNYWIIAITRIYSVLEAKPNCIGEPLKPDQFSNPGDVAFVRDVCVDIIARNIYNKRGFEVSKSCEELAKMRTSGFFKCLKWKRSSKRNEKATNEVTEKAETLMEELLDVLAQKESEETAVDVQEFVYEQTKDAKKRLIDSGAVAENSPLIDMIEDMKLFLCKHCAITENPDMTDAINQFISNNAQGGMAVSNPRIEDSVAHATITGLFRLIFDFGDSADIKTGSAVLKVPSVAPFYNVRWKRAAIYKREAAFYSTILPALYQIGGCEPFAPRAYAVTEGNALVLEDLSNSGCQSVPRLESLDLDHSKIFLLILAQYHAFGYVYYQSVDENNPVKELIGPRKDVIRRAITKDEFDNICKMVKPLLSETLYQKLLRAEDKIQAKLPIQNDNDQNSINVIMHGDLHRKNFLFKYNENGHVIDVKLIDWQIGTLGGLALDLIEFFVHNLHAEFFEPNEDYLLEFYIAIFNHCFASIQSDHSYNRAQLDKDLAFFKYYYFRVLSDTTVYWGASQSTENYNFIATNIAKWIMYFEKKQYI